MKINLRPLISSDESFLYDMLYQALFVPKGSTPFERDTVYSPELAKYVQNWGKESDFGFIAENEKQPMGAIWLRLLSTSEAGYGFIDPQTPELSMALLPEYRQQGIGSALLEKLLETTAYQRISLSVDKRNHASEMYLRWGFKTIKTEENSLTMLWEAPPLK